ncbi:helix-turn-helix domain-containing protein [Flammeovirga agarivorans]|uniref:Helix-turn-helix domain-containing protein n=1 Tax=Flammeovirga agarivorans TaxID=2726742 RepID=A0A7X8SR44_9BACT|nr:AraC family transcriptional regulator [Flammeovirga agarivorans]NLR94717.1 helix-turn-helix domain-containing protein [Flammeovirga agarivorans]
MKFLKTTGEYLEIQNFDITSDQTNLFENSEEKLTLIWFTENDNYLTIDGRRYTFMANEIVFLTEFHQIENIRLNKGKILRFNRPFYCILHHETDVGCKGILFFGASSLPKINLTNTDGETLKSLWQVFEHEMKSSDEHQLEMLQMLLKRLLILCTRIMKRQTDLSTIEEDKMTIVKEFNFLVEQHFREKKSVAEYAELLHKSPKTLSNVFKLLGQKKPLQFIQERVLLEARRQIIYTEKSISEIAYELGYEDLQAFSRFFKKTEGSSPSEYRALHTKKVS